MKETIYLAYGSNLNIEQMSWRCPDARPLGVTMLDGYQLLFRGRMDSGVATVEPNEENQVPVALWRISPADEYVLDRYEGFPSLYRKETVTVCLDGEDVEAMVYVMNPVHPYTLPSAPYLTTIAEGYEDFGLETPYLLQAVRDSQILEELPMR